MDSTKWICKYCGGHKFYIVEYSEEDSTVFKIRITCSICGHYTDYIIS